MAIPLFPSMSFAIDFEPQIGIFYKFQKGWILPIAEIKPDYQLTLEGVFLNGMLTGKFVKHEDITVAYFFISSFTVSCNGASLFAYIKNRAGLAKTCRRVYSDDHIVILDYPNCGVVAISPKVNSAISTIF